jgi:hypothetical protein
MIVAISGLLCVGPEASADGEPLGTPGAAPTPSAAGPTTPTSPLDAAASPARLRRRVRVPPAKATN